MFRSMVRIGSGRSVHADGRGQVIDLVDVGHHAMHQRLVADGTADVGQLRMIVHGGQVLDRPVDSSSTTMTSSPRSSNFSVRCEPMKPAPPVTKTLVTGCHNSQSARPDGQARGPTQRVLQA